jgi:hypothetical protein
MNWPKTKCEGCIHYLTCGVRFYCLSIEYCQYEEKKNE